MPSTHVRVLGGGNTLVYMGLKGNTMVEFLSNFQDTPGGSVGRAEVIQPIGHHYPLEIATPYAQGAGTLKITVWGTWGSDGWVSAFQYSTGQSSADENPWENYKSKGYLGVEGQPVDLFEVLDAQRKLANNIVVRKLELDANGNPYRIKTYEDAVITDMDAGETVKNDSMSSTCTITMMYTKVTVTKDVSIVNTDFLTNGTRI